MSRTYRGPIRPRSSSVRVCGRSGRPQEPVLGGAPLFYFRTHFRYAGPVVAAAEPRKRVLGKRRGYRDSGWVGRRNGGEAAHVQDVDFGRLIRLHVGETSSSRACEVAVKLGDRVRIRPAGASMFAIVDVDDEGRFVLESVDGIPEGYRFPMREEDLLPE